MKNKKTNQYLSDEQKFEQKLFHTLKFYGYLFPDNAKDVDNFEELYGDTEIDIPEHLQSLEMRNHEENLHLDLDFTNNVAAFSPNDPNSFELPIDTDLDKSDEENKRSDESSKTSEK